MRQDQLQVVFLLADTEPIAVIAVTGTVQQLAEASLALLSFTTMIEAAMYILPLGLLR
jgi:hypothetical protein